MITNIIFFHYLLINQVVILHQQDYANTIFNIYF